MLSDIGVIVWKELREMIASKPGLRGGWMGMLVLIGVFGVFMPLTGGAAWVTDPANLAIWGWVPYLLVSGVVADSFAGERERHTLETLLATRLSDQAILFGKVAAAMIYGWGLTLIIIVLGLVTVNVAHGKGVLLFFPLNIFLGILALSFLVALFGAALGVLVSLRASTARQAQQTFSTIFLLFFIPILLFPLLPAEIQARVAQAAMTVNLAQIVLGVMAFLFVLDLILLWAGMQRFRRARLILD